MILLFVLASTAQPESAARPPNLRRGSLRAVSVSPIHHGFGARLLNERRVAALRFDSEELQASKIVGHSEGQVAAAGQVSKAADARAANFARYRRQSYGRAVGAGRPGPDVTARLFGGRGRAVHPAGPAGGMPCH